MELIVTFGDWYKGLAFDVRLGTCTCVLARNQTDSYISCQIKLADTPDDTEPLATVTAFGEYISNNSPVWIKAKLVKDKIKWGSSARSRGGMVKDEVKGWRYFSISEFSYLKLEEILARLNGTARINHPVR